MSITVGGNVTDGVVITGSHNVVILERAAGQVRRQDRDPGQMLRVLAVLAAPVHDPQQPDRPPAPMDLRAEWRRLEQAVRGAQAPILLARMAPPTLDTLRRELSPRAAEQGLFPQVLHFSGHAWKNGLLLEDEYGQAHPVPVAQLLESLQPPQPLDLVVLNACETASEAESAAQALVEAGLARAVVGHTRPVWDDEAIAFARTLYADLTDGYPLRQALANAQRHITTHEVVLLGNGDLCFTGLTRGEPVIDDGRPKGNLPPGESGGRVGFFGRGEELVDIAQHLDRPPGIVLVTGPQGIGKSRLALEAAHRNAWRFPGGAAYAEAPREAAYATAAALLNRLVEALDLTVREEEEIPQALLTHAHTTATLFVLDNLEILPEAELQRLADFLARLGGGSAAVVTQRPPQPVLEDLAQAFSLPLHEGLAEGAAVRYALALAKERHIPLDEERAWEIADAADGHPLLVQTLVAQARRQDLGELLAEVRQRRGHFAQQLERVYAWSAERLGKAGRRAWQALPLFPASNAPERPLRAAAGGREGLEELRGAALADFDPADQVWRWHGTVSEYARLHWPLTEEALRERRAALLGDWTAWLEGLSKEEASARLEVTLPNLEPVLALSRHVPREAVWAFLEALRAMLPTPDRTLSLRAVQAPLYRTMADLAADDAGRARALNNLGYALSALGRREEALKATQEAMKIYRDLAQTHPQAFLADLAASLNNLGNHLSALGRREEALSATQEAVDLYRQLGAQNPQAFLRDLARSLNNLGNGLSELGRREEALAATQRAVDVYRDLAAQNPQAFLPDLAATLNNLGAMLSALGRHEEALAATQEALDLHRQLAAQNPQAFLPDLALSLNNLGNRLSTLGRPEEALKATQEAVEIYRDLAAENPQPFLPDLATSLNNLGAMLSALGQREEALAVTQEAVEIRRKLAQANPQTFLPYLATSLNNLGRDLSEVGQREEALKATQEAVEIRRQLARANPQTFLPYLATSLSNLGAILSALGRREEALSATQEAVDIRRQLAQANPQAFLPDLALSLNNLGRDLFELGQPEEALAATQEAVEIYRDLAAQTHQAFLPDLAKSLGGHGTMLLALGRPAEAAATSREGLEILLPFARALPQAYGSLLGALVHDYRRAAQAAGQASDASLVRQAEDIVGASGEG